MGGCCRSQRQRQAPSPVDHSEEWSLLRGCGFLRIHSELMSLMLNSHYSTVSQQVQQEERETGLTRIPPSVPSKQRASSIFTVVKGVKPYLLNRRYMFPTKYIFLDEAALIALPRHEACYRRSISTRGDGVAQLFCSSAAMLASSSLEYSTSSFSVSVRWSPNL